jgi:hypothetical protein
MPVLSRKMVEQSDDLDQFADSVTESPKGETFQELLWVAVEHVEFGVTAFAITVLASLARSALRVESRLSYVYH